MTARATTRLFLILLLVSITGLRANAQVTITDDISADVTWTADNEYILDGLIFVNDGATLTIEAGTVIKGLEQSNITTGDGATALIIRRGGKIEAVGTAQAPIIFTSEFDDVNDPDDMLDNSGDHPERGLWGGVILLGRATTNQPTTDNQIEGISADDEEALFGGTDDQDNSGTLKYVSIRHGGFSISGVAGDEINGLTMGAVGSGTTIEYVEVFANLDDCYEWFGGTVNTRYLVGAMCGDDTFDYDQGFRGKGQFWFSIHDTDLAGRGGEHDGGDSGGDDAEPFSIPVISNVTYIGSGDTAPVGGDNNDRTFAIRDNAGGMYWNSIFTDYPGVAINIEDIEGADSRERLETGDLAFQNNIFFDFGAGATFADIVDGTFADATIAATNQISDPQLAGICRTQNRCLDPRPVAGGTALSGAQDTGDDFFVNVDFVGAFGEDLWIEDWTALSAGGYVGRISTVAIEEIADAAVPASYVLDQNYPNPFNPVTTIEFGLNETRDVRLAVYDMLGREVSVLVDDVRTAGVYRVTFDGAALSSGLYLYRLEVDGNIITRSMTLLK